MKNVPEVLYMQVFGNEEDKDLQKYTYFKDCFYIFTTHRKSSNDIQYIRYDILQKIMKNEIYCTNCKFYIPDKQYCEKTIYRNRPANQFYCSNHPLIDIK